jgi:hypothetical protein
VLSFWFCLHSQRFFTGTEDANMIKRESGCMWVVLWMLQIGFYSVIRIGLLALISFNSRFITFFTTVVGLRRGGGVLNETRICRSKGKSCCALRTTRCSLQYSSSFFMACATHNETSKRYSHSQEYISLVRKAFLSSSTCYRDRFLPPSPKSNTHK